MKAWGSLSSALSRAPSPDLFQTGKKYLLTLPPAEHRPSTVPRKAGEHPAPKEQPEDNPGGARPGWEVCDQIVDRMTILSVQVGGDLGDTVCGKGGKHNYNKHVQSTCTARTCARFCRHCYSHFTEENTEALRRLAQVHTPNKW